MKRQPTPPEIVILVAGLVALIGSFLPFWELGPFSTSAWGDVFPLATYVAIFGTIMALAVGLPLVSDVKLPDQLLGFSLPQVHVVLGLFSTLIMLGFVFLDNPGTGIGYVLLLLAAIGRLVGAVLHARERSAI